MRTTKFSARLTAVLAIFTTTLLVMTARAAALQEAVLYNFGNGTDGSGPKASLISDAAGNLYGTTYGGGAHRGGTVFQLTAKQGGGWSENILFSFNGGAYSDPFGPSGSLVFDTQGNLYGTTRFGGVGNGGTVFELTHTSGGNWTLKILCTFAGLSNPSGNLIFDSSGNLYGTTSGGINSQGGITPGEVFKLTPIAQGTWRKQILHSFDGSPDGSYPGPAWFLTPPGIFTGRPTPGAAATSELFSN